MTRLEEIVHPKINIGWQFTHPHVILDVEVLFIFIFSSEQIWRFLALHHLLTNGSSAVNGCRQEF